MMELECAGRGRGGGESGRTGRVSDFLVLELEASETVSFSGKGMT